jgi:hypothetical protein
MRCKPKDLIRTSLVSHFLAFLYSKALFCNSFVCHFLQLSNFSNRYSYQWFAMHIGPCIVMILKNHFEWLQHVSCYGSQCVGITLENIVITTIATNSSNISYFELHALQQYSYIISDLELQAVSYNSRQAVLQPNPSASTIFQSISYNSSNRRRLGLRRT